MKPITFIILVVLSSAFLFSCKKDSYNIPTGNGQVEIVFSNRAGSSDLVLGDSYTNEHGDHFAVSMFKYYISNIKLNGSNASYAEAESYHLIDQNNMAGATFIMQNLPYGQYTSMTFTVGVDSLRNVSGAQTGALDPANNMFWTWSTGYIMLKCEGTSPQSTQPGHALTFHLGGFSGVNSALRTVTINFPNPISVTGEINSISHVNVNADMLALFKSPDVIDFSTLSLVHAPGPNVTRLAGNYTNMFSVASSGH